MRWHNATLLTCIAYKSKMGFTMAKIVKQTKRAIAKSSKPASVKRGKVIATAKAKPAKAKREHIGADTIADNAKLLRIDMNTMRKGSDVHTRFAKLKKGMTKAKAMELGVSGYDLACALERNRIAFSK